MPLPGGPADKIGNRYELKWTADNLVRVLLGTASEIRLEEPGVDSAEFWINVGGTREYHQVKRQQTNAAGWTLPALKTEGVLAGFWARLQAPNTRCVFISTHSVADLQKICERANQAADASEFIHAFSADHASKSAIARLTSEWGCTDGAVYEAVRRIRVVTLDEDTLDEKVRLAIRVAVHGNVEAALSKLMTCALERVHSNLNADDLWAELANVDVTRSGLGSGSLRRHIESITQEYLADSSFVPILDKTVERKETGKILAHLSEGRRLVLIHGVAGTGKTGVLRQVIESQRASGNLVLATRLDRVEPATRSEGLGTSLGLSMSPIVALAGAAQGDQAKLIVLDQADSICLAAGRHPEFLEGVASLIREASFREDTSIVLACRTYDLDGDPRLQALAKKHQAAKVQIAAFDRASIIAILNTCGVETRNLSESQLRLLANPLHLFLLTEIVHAHGYSEVRLFESGTDLLAAYWRRKPLQIRERHGRLPAWGPLLGTLCEAMDRRGLLSVPESVLDSFDPADVELLCSEHVLSRVDGRLSFFHESFFDYVFARGFVSANRDAADTFRNGDQGLLRRAQLRRVLTLLASEDCTEFRRVASTLLHDTTVRFHLVVAVLESFRELVGPGPDDWEVLRRWGDTGQTALRHIDTTVFRQPGWADFFSDAGVFDRWLRTPDRAEFAVRSMVASYSIRPELIPKHLGAWIDEGEYRPDLVGYAFEMCSPRGSTTSTEQFFISLVDRGLLPERILTPLGGAVDFWRALRMSRKEEPGLTLKLAAMHLRQQYHRHGWKKALKVSSRDAQEILEAAARAAPREFLMLFAPLFIELLAISEVSSQHDEQFKEDAIWQYRGSRPHFEIRHVILAMIVDALVTLGPDDPTANSWLNEFLKSDFSTAHFVVFAAAGSGVIADAVSVRRLIVYRANYHSLDIGYRDAPYHVTKLAIEQVAKACSHEELLELEDAILKYYPATERHPMAILNLRPSYHGHAQWQLLAGIPAAMLSLQAKRRLQEWERKFCSWERLRSRTKRAESPISPRNVPRLRDDDWLNAIRKYDYRDRRSILDGGAHELSGELEKSAQQDPERFAALALKLPLDCAPSYLSAILRGIANSDLSVDTLARVVAAAHSRPDRQCTRSICWLMDKKPERAWPEESLSALGVYATMGRSPQDESWIVLASGGEWEESDLLHLGINSDRGAALDAISGLLRASPERRFAFEPILIDVANRERCDEVRACAVLCCTALLGVDPSGACSLFHALVGPFARVLASDPARHFLTQAAYWAPDESLRLVEQSLRSPISTARKGGGAAVYVGWLYNPNLFENLISLVYAGDEAARIGAAEALAGLVTVECFSDTAFEHLIRLLNDPSHLVRQAASGSIYEVKDDPLKLGRLAEAFYETQAFGDDSYALVERLKQSRTASVRLSIRLGREFLKRKAADAADIRTHGAFEASHVAELIVGASTRARGAEREECLDILDELLRIQAYGVVDAIDQALM